MTGRRASGSRSGVQTLRNRQSSLCGSDASGSDGLVIPGTAAAWGAIAPNVDASLIVSHGSGGSGGRQRSGPTGARAYGTPENDHRSPRHTPRNRP